MLPVGTRPRCISGRGVFASIIHHLQRLIILQTAAFPWSWQDTLSRLDKPARKLLIYHPRAVDCWRSWRTLFVCLWTTQKSSISVVRCHGNFASQQSCWGSFYSVLIGDDVGEACGEIVLMSSVHSSEISLHLSWNFRPQDVRQIARNREKDIVMIFTSNTRLLLLLSTFVCSVVKPAPFLNTY